GSSVPSQSSRPKARNTLMTVLSVEPWPFSSLDSVTGLMFAMSARVRWSMSSYRRARRICPPKPVSSITISFLSIAVDLTINLQKYVSYLGIGHCRAEPVNTCRWIVHRLDGAVERVCAHRDDPGCPNSL